MPCRKAARQYSRDRSWLRPIENCRQFLRKDHNNTIHIWLRPRAGQVAFAATGNSPSSKKDDSIRLQSAFGPCYLLSSVTDCFDHSQGFFSKPPERQLGAGDRIDGNVDLEMVFSGFPLRSPPSFDGKTSREMALRGCSRGGPRKSGCTCTRCVCLENQSCSGETRA